MHSAEQILYDILTEEILRSYLLESVFYDNVDLEKGCKDFVYLHEIVSIETGEDLTDDFEPSGTLQYKLRSKKGSFLEASFNYSDGDVFSIDYDVKDHQNFKALLTYAVDIVTKNLKDKILDNYVV